MFLIGGMQHRLASPPIDFAVNDTYYVVARFAHRDGLLYGMFAGFYFWFQLTGRLLSERLWPLLAVPDRLQHDLLLYKFLVELMTPPRRIADYQIERWASANLLSTVGAFLTGVSVLVFMWNFWSPIRRG